MRDGESRVLSAFGSYLGVRPRVPCRRAMHGAGVGLRLRDRLLAHEELPDRDGDQAGGRAGEGAATLGAQHGRADGTALAGAEEARSAEERIHPGTVVADECGHHLTDERTAGSERGEHAAPAPAVDTSERRGGTHAE